LTSLLATPFAILACSSQPTGAGDLQAGNARSTSALSAFDPAARFQAFDSAVEFQPAVTPLGVSGGGRVRVIVHLSAEPVAEVQTRLGRKLSEPEHEGAEAAVRAQHAAAEPGIQAHGGRVLARFRDAVNGLKVDIDRREVPALAAMPGVVKVSPVRVYQRNNAVSVPFIGAPAAWQGSGGFRGERVKVAILDTGIDYTHANFGGPGTVAAYAAAFAAGTLPADPALFGPGAPKVKGGTDLVGDDYDAAAAAGSPQLIPQPDPNPLDCNGDNVGHGSHVAGTAAGFGVAADGTTFTGPYDTTTPTRKFTIGPGVAPRADLYAVRVFGCAGSTDVVVDAIDWAVHNRMDVINMSLGSPFGVGDDASAVAADNAARAGVLVVASAGNSGAAPYLTGAPATGDRVISVAATDATASIPRSTVLLDSGASVVAQSFGITSPDNGTSLPVFVLRNSAGGISLGCSEAEYVDAQISGKFVVALRGTCPLIDRGHFGQAHGAAGVGIINNAAAGYPPFLGPLPEVPIPFVSFLAADGAALAGSASVTFTASSVIPNPTFRNLASFSSGGPRFGDSFLKPNLTAPGAGIVSTRVGSGNQGQNLGGTSMAAPHVAGVAALVHQAHPSWTPAEQRAAIVQTADPSALLGAGPRTAGAGLVQPAGATRTQAVVLQHGEAAASVSFGFQELSRDFRDSQTLAVRNHGRSTITFKVTATPVGGSPHAVTFNRTSLRVAPGSSAGLEVSLAVPAATAGDASGFREVAGYVTLTPALPAQNGGVALTVPYYLVPRALSRVNADAQHFGPRRPSSSVRVSNRGAAIAGNADFYAWGLSSKPQGLSFFDPRAVGVQAFPGAFPDDSLLVFAVNTHTRFSNAAAGEFDIFVDVSGDGVPDFDVVGIDLGALTTGSFNGTLAVAVVNLTSGNALIRFLAEAPTDGSTVLLPVRATDLGLSAASPRFTYFASVFNLLDDSFADVPGTASFNAFSPAISTGMFETLAPNTTVVVPVTVDPTEWALTPAKGLMAVTEDNAAGRGEADLLEAN
jgi:subtilisin family serine protease